MTVPCCGSCQRKDNSPCCSPNGLLLCVVHCNAATNFLTLTELTHFLLGLHLVWGHHSSLRRVWLSPNKGPAFPERFIPWPWLALGPLFLCLYGLCISEAHETPPSVSPEGNSSAGRGGSCLFSWAVCHRRLHTEGPSCLRAQSRLELCEFHGVTGTFLSL